MTKNNVLRSMLCCGVAAVLFLTVTQAGAQPVNGKIFTTDVNGASVNKNIYTNKDAVYLSGGPNNCTAGPGLTDGTYVFQVTTPSGKVLSTDGVDARGTFTASGGYITGYTGAHATVNFTCGSGDTAITTVGIQLQPFDDTDNAGGEYKAFACLTGGNKACTEVAASHADAFPPNQTKSDNFKVLPSSTGVADWPLQGFKFYDGNANGVYDTGDTVIPNWPMRGIGGSAMIDPPVAQKNYGAGCDPTDPSTCGYYSAVVTTDANGEYQFGKLTVGGVYGVCEASASASGFTWVPTTQRPLHSNGGTSYETQIFCPRHVKPSYGTAPDIANESQNSGANDQACLVAGTAPPGPDIQVGGVYVNIDPGRGPVEFGNVCVGGGTGALTLGFWSNKNGQNLETAGDFTLLTGLNLKNADGSDRDFTAALATNKTALNGWLLSASASNMANMLSAQLAAMELNVNHGLVTGSSQVYAGTAPAACSVAGLSPTGFISINDLMTAGNSQLALNSITVQASAARSCEEFVKTALDKANNNLNFLQSNGSACILATTWTDCSAPDVSNTETGINTGIGFIPPPLN